MATKWTQKDGLPGADVRKIAQTPDGYLWLATETGLVRFDGVRFKTFAAPPDVPSFAPSELFVASDGSLWVGLASGGIVHLGHESAQYFHPGDGLPAGGVMAIRQDDAGTLWIGTRGGIAQFQKDQARVLGIQQGFSGNRVDAIAENRTGIWIGSDVGLLYWNPAQNRFEREHGVTNYVIALNTDSQGHVWFADTSRGLQKLHGEASEPHWNKGNSFLEDRSGNLWMGSDNQGVLVMQRQPRAPGGLERARFGLREGLSNNHINCMFEDREGDIWIGTRNGLNRLRPTGFRPVRDARVATSSIYSIAATHNSLWVVADWRPYHVEEEGQTESVAAQQAQVFFSSQGSVVMAGRNFVAESRRGHFHRLAIGKRSLVRNLFDVARDAAGSLWLLSSGGLMRWQAGQITSFPELSGKPINTIVVDHDRVWAGAQDGLWEFAGQWRHYTPAEGISEHAVHSIYVDRAGVLWVTQANVINRLQGDRFVTFHPNLPSGGIVSMVDDDDGCLWLVHTAGLFRIATSEWTRALEDPGYQIRSARFDEKDGLPSNPPAFLGHVAARTQDGTLWFGLRSGMVSVNPKNLSRNPVPPPVVIEEANLDQHEIAPRNGFGIPAGARSLEIGYTALSLAVPEKTRFRVKLEPFDKEWVDSGSRRRAFYTNLAPGNYRFRVIACNNDGLWNETGAAWSFTVTPAFYQKTWFFALCAGTAVLMLWGLYLFRIRQLQAHHQILIEERVAERTRVAQELHDTLLQSIAGLSLHVGGLSKIVTSQEVRERLESLRVQIDNCLREARQSVWALRTQNVDRHDLAAAVKESACRLIADRPIRFDLSIQGVRRPVSDRVEQQILRVAQEAISNCIRHARATRIQADLDFGTDQVALKVTDDGCGFDVDDVARRVGHWGLITMKERAQQVGAQLKINSTAGQGTEIEAVFPLSVD
ncbi:MAG TPA: two-component regulator propeller domain-containing protein [Candidatus Angelobacter sp.]|nr:two-component regulator propeller domain-containing protein [Candidatus Angelobacter sp.]